MFDFNKRRASGLKMLEIWSAACAIALIAATHALWFPSSLDTTFPQVPLFQPFCSWPRWADYVGAGCLIAGWLMVMLGWRSVGCVCVLVTGTLLVCLNQHRLQPWHYQLLIFALVFSLVSTQLQPRAMRILVISVYLFSALSKLDYEFLHTVGQQFLGQLLCFVGLDSWGSGSTRILLASTIPLSELLLATGLIFPATRRWAGVGVCAMHCLLLLLLGPWGLNHSWGVLLWNVHFGGVAWLLFVWPGARQMESHVSEPQAARPLTSAKQPGSPGSSTGMVRLQVGDWLATALLVPVLVMPVFERFGLWDHWPSWALYSPHSSRVEISVATTAVERLPEPLHRLTQLRDNDELWVRLPIETWALQTLGVPVYPQARFQLGVARSLAEQLSTEFELRADMMGVASRFSGRRTRVRFEGISAITRASKNFVFSTLPRQTAP